jgi:hypothetical protein
MAKENKKQSKMKDKKFCKWVKSLDWLDRLSQVVTIFGIISVVAIVFDYRKELKEGKTDKNIIDAISIFQAAESLDEFKTAFEKFQDIKELRPNNLTGFNLFFDKAEDIVEGIQKENDGYLVYDSISTPIALSLLYYADSLNDTKPNKAIKLIKYFNSIK